MGLGLGLCTGRVEPERKQALILSLLFPMTVKSSLDFLEMMPRVPNDPSSLKVTFVKCSTETSCTPVSLSFLSPCPFLSASCPPRCERADAADSCCHGAGAHHTLPDDLELTSHEPKYASPLRHCLLSGIWSHSGFMKEIALELSSKDEETFSKLKDQTREEGPSG